MNFLNKFLIILSVSLIVFGLCSNSVFAKPKKRIIYKKYTELDFSGQTIQGKVRAPEVFYIFQRKRGQLHDILRPPKRLHHQRSITLFQLRRALPK